MVVASVAGAACSGGGTADISRSPDGSSPGVSVSVDPSSTTAPPSPPPEPTAAADDLLRIGLTGVDSIDPAGTSPASVAQMMVADLFYDGLTRSDDEGRAVPALAEFDVDETGTVWRFTLRDDVGFADGSPITADDVVSSLDRVRARVGSSLAAARLDDVVSIVAVDERSVDITLSAPSAVLPEILASPLFPIADRDAIAVFLDGGDQTPNGSGDYSVVIDQVNRFVLTRRRGGGPESVVIDLFADEGAAFDAFLAGDVDWVVAPPSRIGDAIDAAGDDGFVPFHGSVLIGIDADAGPLMDPRLRRAISLAIDRQVVSDAAFGPAAQPAVGIVPAGVFGAAASCLSPCGPNLVEARRLVRAVFPDGQSSPVRLLIDDSTSQASVAGVVEQQLESVGIDVEVSAVDVGTYESLVTGGQQQLFLFGSLGVGLTPASHVAPLFASMSPDNVIGFADPAIDFGIAASRAERDSAARAMGWASVERAVLDQAVVIPLVQFRTTGVSSDRLSGFEVRADGSVDLDAVTLDGG